MVDWRGVFPEERGGLWHKVVVNIFGTHPNGWDVMEVQRSHRFPWKVIAQGFQMFSQFISLVVWIEDRILFQEDI